MGLFHRFRKNASDKTGKSSTNIDVQNLIEQGHAHEADGNLDAAMQCYLAALQLEPHSARAHLNCGNVLLAKGQLENALKAFSTALEHDPTYAAAYYNIGNALLGNGQVDIAAKNYRKALELKPDFAEAHCSLGITLQKLGQPDSAEACHRRAIELKPDFVEAHYNLGILMKNLHRPEEALTCFRHALQLKPDFIDASHAADETLKVIFQIQTHYNQAITEQQSGHFENAAINYQKTLELKPAFFEALNNLGVTLHELGRLNEAAECYRRALALKPDFAIYGRLGTVLFELGQFENAITNYRNAIQLKPDFFEAHNNLGLALQEVGQFEDALTTYRKALEIRPDFTDAHDNLLLLLNYIEEITPSYYLDQALRYGGIVRQNVRMPFSAWSSTMPPKRLRVGVVSGDMRNHSVGHFLVGFLSHIDPERIELIAYPSYSGEDQLTARIKPHFAAWKPIASLDDEAAARLIHADGVHILLDLSGHTAHNRLPVFAWKPAPVQVTWLGLPCTTGMKEIDYVLGDAVAIPPEHENHFSEAVWRLPDSYLCFSAPPYPLDVASLPAMTSGHITFGSFNNLTKINDAVVELWSRILLRVPNSRLYLKTSQLGNENIREQTRKRFAAWGIAPERLLLSGSLGSHADHLAEYDKIDIALDTFPYPGITTSIEALWMGVPVLTLHGDRFISLTAESIAHQSGLPDWVASDKSSYIAKAEAFSADLEHLAALRTRLRQQVLASPLFDTSRFARNFEDAMWNMWHTRINAPAGTTSFSSPNEFLQDTVSITLANGIHVVAPKSPQHMTTFVLHEQHDWFEDEIHFIRRFIQPGMHAIDIGANFGLYALNIAKIIGENGRLWAFEPASSTAACLGLSIGENGFSNITLVQAGLSNRCGKAKLFTSSSSELNSLSQAAAGSGSFETIELSTLDSCYAKYDWNHIDFIKMDAEGEESNIIKGGEAFLSAASPLIMFELMHGQETASLPLTDKFHSLHYHSYRLVPALNVLIPFDHSQSFDESLLNLFCCKDDCAARLERDGILVKTWEEKTDRSSAYATRYLNDCEFADQLLTVPNPFKTARSESYAKILECYLASRSDDIGGSDRIAYLMGALNLAKHAFEQGERSIIRLTVYARIAIDAGERSLGVRILGMLIDRYQDKLDFDIDEWFLPATARYDNIDPEGKIREWLMSSIIEQYLLKHAFSAYFTGSASLPLFEKLHQLGFMDEILRQRHTFVKSIFAP